MEQLSKKLGLRGRQRHRRHRDIVFAAAELFAAKGFAETTMEDIATRAEVSPPTIYNYFRSKSDILLGLLEISKEMMDKSLDRIIEDPKGDPIDVVCEFVRIDLEDAYDYRQKNVWRMISAAALEANDERRSSYMKVQSIFTVKLEKLLRQMQARGSITAEVDPIVAAQLLNAITRDVFRLYISVDAMSIEEMHARFRSQVTLLWQAMRTHSKKATS
ncbi:AcrR family transcriptional regulator [Neorhizobium galegae]|uniref:TetR/AcrR family transcriptional regulator n=1 Tax=Neorhizobium galegae TaxID=399 RepID=UPI001AEA9E44|nr:TetR/AcrR family transcriptional regulator [Neorhizobium galegae]MBP2561134.1 AcrR family transcriptional regulator [Neorhizobium galegae]MDQ0134131.1 AcrR family transcriptional regulator [Neorhizobium galegae]